MIAKSDEIRATSPAPGVTRKVISRGGGLMGAEFRFEKGAVGAMHTHPHEQIGYVVRGRVELEMEGTKTVLAAGDSYYVKPGTAHGVVALEETVLVDVFTPQRDDFLQ